MSNRTTASVTLERVQTCDIPEISLDEEPPPQAGSIDQRLDPFGGALQSSTQLEAPLSPKSASLKCDIAGWRPEHMNLEQIPMTRADDPTWLMDGKGPQELKMVAVACPRARWTPDKEVSACQHPGCDVRFGYLGMPGMSWASRSSFSKGNDGECMSSFSSLTKFASTPMSMLPPSMPLARRDSASTISSLDSQNMVDLETQSGFKDLMRRPDLLSGRSHSSDASMPQSWRLGCRSQPVSKQVTVDNEGFALPLTPTRSGFKSSTSSLLSSSPGSTRSLAAKQQMQLPQSPIKVNRRHHCRRCGASFCGRHANDFVALSLADIKEQPSAAQSSQGSSSTDLEQLQSASTASVTQLSQSSQASYALRDLLEHGKLLPRGTFSEARAAGIFTGRVCKECNGYYQSSKNKYLEALRMSGEQDSIPPSQPTAHDSMGNATPLATSSVSTPQIEVPSLWPFETTPQRQVEMCEMETQEYIESKERIFREEVREAVEVLKVLRNDHSANRTVAAAVAMGPRSDASSVLRRHMASINAMRSTSPALSSGAGSPIPAFRQSPVIANAARSLEPLTRLGIESDEGSTVLGKTESASQSLFRAGSASMQSHRRSSADSITSPLYSSRDSRYQSDLSTNTKRRCMKTVEERDMELELRFAAQSTIALAAGAGAKPRRAGWTWGRPSRDNLGEGYECDQGHP